MTATNVDWTSQLLLRSGIKISHRKASLTDAHSIAVLGAQTWSTAYGYSIPLEELRAYLDQNYSPEAISKDIADTNKTLIVATTRPTDHSDETITGFALLTRGTTDPCLSRFSASALIELQKLYIHPAYQGHGIAPFLCAQLEGLARSQDYTHIWLGVWEEAAKAQRVYDRMGYKKVGEHDFVLVNVVQRDWVIIKELC